MRILPIVCFPLVKSLLPSCVNSNVSDAADQPIHPLTKVVSRGLIASPLIPLPCSWSKTAGFKHACSRTSCALQASMSGRPRMANEVWRRSIISLPDLVISDIEMPHMTGYELCSAVKGDPQLRSIPFILLSTLADAQDIIKGLHCGADSYVTKPYDPDFLLARVRALLETPLQFEGEEQELQVNLGGNRYQVKGGAAASTESARLHL